jgi:hypothetical protein
MRYATQWSQFASGAEKKGRKNGDIHHVDALGRDE